MKISHPPEPWTTVCYENVDYQHVGYVTIDHAGDGTVVDGVEKVTAERIVTCVNACAGISEEDLKDAIRIGIAAIQSGEPYIAEREGKFYIARKFSTEESS